MAASHSMPGYDMSMSLLTPKAMPKIWLSSGGSGTWVAPFFDPLGDPNSPFLSKVLKSYWAPIGKHHLPTTICPGPSPRIQISSNHRQWIQINLSGIPSCFPIFFNRETQHVWSLCYGQVINLNSFRGSKIHMLMDDLVGWLVDLFLYWSCHVCLIWMTTPDPWGFEQLKK